MTSKKEILDMSDEKFMKLFDSLIEEVFEEVYSNSKSDLIYESIAEYTKKTGKRFRMTKEQKNKGLSRDEAFKEFIESE